MPNIDKVIRRSFSRNKTPSAFVGFLKSYKTSLKLYKTVENSAQVEQEILLAAKLQFLANCVRSLETMFRDSFIGAADFNKEFEHYLKDKYWKSKYGAYPEENEYRLDMLLSQVNLQNIKNVNEIFGFFSNKTLFEEIIIDNSATVFVLDKNDQVHGAQIRPTHFLPGFIEGLETIFNIRHEYTHNANAQFVIPDFLFRFFCKCTFYFAQLFCLRMNDKLSEMTGSRNQFWNLPSISADSSLGFKYALMLSAPDLTVEKAEEIRDYVDEMKPDIEKNFGENNKRPWQVGPFFLYFDDISRTIIDKEIEKTKKFRPQNTIHCFDLDENSQLILSSIRSVEE